MTQLVPIEQQVSAFSMDREELLFTLQNSVYPGAKKPSVELALSYCAAQRLDPLQKPVHIVPMWDSGIRQMRDIIMPGIGLYRVQAARTGQHAGTSEPEFGPLVTKKLDAVEITFPEWCRVTVRRALASGQVCEFTAVEYWEENYATAGKDDKGNKTIAPNAMWRKRPRGQLAKCAEAQALRKAFPELGAAPTAEEMEGKVIEVEQQIAPDDVVGRLQASSGTARQECVETFNAMSAEQQTFLKDKAVELIAEHELPTGDAFGMWQRLRLDAEETLAIWSLLPSTLRTPLKKAIEKAKSAAKPEPALEAQP